jgi:hypothetical protein
MVIAGVLGIALLARLPARSAASGSEVSADPIFKALLIDGSATSGRIVSVASEAITLSSLDGATQKLPLKRLIRISREVPPTIAPQDRSHVILPEGDCLMRVVVGSASDTSLEVQSDALGKLALPLDSLLGLILGAPAQTGGVESLWDRVLVEPRSTEVIWLQNGDRLAGGFLGLDEHTIKIQLDGKPMDVDRSGVLGVAFDPALVVYPRPQRDFIEATLKDGTRLGVRDAKIEGGIVSATARFGQRIRFPLGEIVRLAARTSSFVYLSEREPAQAEYVPYIGPTRPFRNNRTVDGRFLRLSGQTYDRGIGTESRTLLAYRIEPGDRRFQALVGLDERAGPLGSVIFRVLLDGKERFASPALCARDLPRAVDLELSGARFLILITEFGDRGSVRDVADWVEARVIR